MYYTLELVAAWLLFGTGVSGGLELAAGVVLSGEAGPPLPQPAAGQLEGGRSSSLSPGGHQVLPGGWMRPGPRSGLVVGELGTGRDVDANGGYEEVASPLHTM